MVVAPGLCKVRSNSFGHGLGYAPQHMLDLLDGDGTHVSCISRHVPNSKEFMPHGGHMGTKSGVV